MAPMEDLSNQNVVARVANLPLVSSTYDMVLHAYCITKDNHPYVKSVCEAAEIGVKTITSVALISALPIIGKLELHIALANDFACKGLDKMEKTLPILHQPSDQIVASAREAVTGAKEVMTGTVTGAKDTVSHTLTDVMDRTRSAVQDGVEMTRTVVNGGVHTVMESRMAKMVSSGVDVALSTSENLVEQYLPDTDADQGNEVKMTEGFEGDGDSETLSYYVRLGSLSTKLRQRAYHTAVSRVHDARQRSQGSIAQLIFAMEMVEYGKSRIDGANQKVYEKLNALLEWQFKSQQPGNGSNAESDVEQIESRTLAIARDLTQQLQTTCLSLVSRLQGLPNHVQAQAHSVSILAMDLFVNFNKANAYSDLSDGFLATGRAQLGHMKESLDDVMDYLVNNTPLNWLVGPFYPRMEPATPPQSRLSSPQCRSKPESGVEMKSLDCEH